MPVYFGELAAPLPFISDHAMVKHLVGILEGQKATIESQGPTEDYVRLQLLLAQGEALYDLEASRNRLIHIYLYVDEVDEIGTKIDCLAWMLTFLQIIDPKRQFEIRDKLHTLAESDLRADIGKLFGSTADHYQVIRRVVKALARTKPDLALEFITNVNTETRRNKALLEMTISSLQGPISKIDLNLIQILIDRITNMELRDEAFLKVIERFSGETENIESLLGNFVPLIRKIENVQDAGDRCKAYCLVYCLLANHGGKKYSGLLPNLISNMGVAWQTIDVGWQKVNRGFAIVKTLAECAAEKARDYLTQTEDMRYEVRLDAENAALTYMGCVRLAIRAYAGLLPKNIATKDDLEQLTELIDQIPSNGERAALWAELALRYYANKHPDGCKRIATEHIKPLLQNLPDGDARYKAESLVVVAPSLYLAHKLTALEQISKLPDPQRDQAYGNICEFILRKQPPDDPYDDLGEEGYELTYEEVVDICELISLIEQDNLIYRFVKDISNSVASGRGRDTFSQQQRTDIVRRLKEVIGKRLPNPKFIRHDGYKVIALAQVLRIEQARLQGWQLLIDEAHKIPNLADKALVLGLIASVMPCKEIATSIKLFEEVKEIIEKIPMTRDRTERYEELASLVLEKDPTMCRECLRLAMKQTLEANDPDLIRSQRRIIDLAYKLDPNLAATLASLADKDPARTKMQTALKRELEILELKKKIADQRMSAEEWSASNVKLPSTAWRLLGALNAGRIDTMHIEQTRDCVKIAGNMELSKAYPIFAWVIENAVKRYSRTDQAATFICPIYEATLLGVRFAGRIAIQSSEQLQRAKHYVVKSSAVTSVLIRSGERENAIDFLRDWFTHEVKDYLEICDPYFGPDDLEVLQLLRSVNPACRVRILTSKKHQEQEKVQVPWELSYRTQWRVRISDQEPPNTDIIIVGTEFGGDLPIHDRWWLTNGGGIRIGTSYNSLGKGKDSEISLLSREDAEIRAKEMEQFFQRTKREHNGARLLYTLFTL